MREAQESERGPFLFLSDKTWFLFVRLWIIPETNILENEDVRPSVNASFPKLEDEAKCLF